MSNRNSPEDIYREGLGQLAEGQAARACDAFCRVLALCPDALDDIAATFGGPRDRAAAMEALASSPDAARHALAARLARDLGRAGEALEQARRATELDPDCAAWWFERGENDRAAGDLESARTAYQRCLALDPRHAAARTRLAVARKRRGSALARLLARSPLTHRLLRRLGWSYGALVALEGGRDSAAVHQMRWARALEQGSAVSLFVTTPESMRPENFGEHWKNCFCTFWTWFRAQGIEGEIRRVLDVGCGTGFATEHFVRQGFDVTGVTVNPHERDECLQRGIKIHERDFHYMSLPDGGFDLVFSSHSLEHSSSPLFALWEWRRVLRPGGYLMIAIPMPAEQDARAMFPEHCIEATGTLAFPTTGDRALSYAEVCTAASTFGATLHVFVLSYWQLRGLFRLTGFEVVNEAVEDPITWEVLGLEHVDGRLPRDPGHVLNLMFLLRKPPS